METVKRLIPYSVHLSEDVYLKLKEVAKDRKASALVRDAITMILEGNDAFDSGYLKGVRDCVKIVNENQNAAAVSFHGNSLAVELVDQMYDLIEVSK